MTTAKLVRSHEVREVTVHLADADDMRADYSSIGRMIRPDRLELSWRRRDTEPWQLTGAKVSGPIVLASGKPSDSQRMDRQLAWPMISGAQWRDDAPEWARNMETAYAPAEVTA